MQVWWTIVLAALWGLMLLEGVLLLGGLRQLGILHRRIDELSKAAPPLSASQGLPIGAAAPEFTLPQLGGGRHSLRDFQGCRLLLAFVSPGCGPCEELLPCLETLAGRTDTAEVHVLAVSMGRPRVAEELKAWHRFRLPILVQENQEIAELYKTKITPYLYVIDAHGVVRGHGVANTSAEVDRLLARVS